ncbi:MAG: dipeptidase [Chloroflexota bacterium]
MLTLTDEQEQRAKRLQHESFVFDYFPRGEPMTLSPSEEKAMDDALAAGTPAGAVLNVIVDRRTKDIASDPAAADRLLSMWQASGVNAVTCTLGGLDPRYDDRENLVRDRARWQRRFEVADYITHCHSADELERAFAEGKVGVFMNLQNATYLGDDLSNLDVLYDFGVRMIQLTYNRRNLLGDGCTERVQGGLTHFGVQAVKRMNELGIVVDTGHCGIQTTLDAMDASSQPIAISHSGSRVVYDHPRNKTDDQMRALADHDGYMGVYTVPYFICNDPDPQLDIFLAHFEHCANLVGLERMGIGTDWGSWSLDLPARLRAGVEEVFATRGFQGYRQAHTVGELVAYTDWIHITRALVSRGYRDAEVQGILGGNFLRFLRRAVG